MALDQAVQQESWASELENWKSIPASSHVWDDLEPFIAALREVASAKTVEREAGRNALRDALAEMSAEFAEDLEYFEASTGSWSAEAIDRAQAEAVAYRVLELVEEMRSRRALQAAIPAHYAEARRVRQEISAEEDAIFSHIEALGSEFAIGSPAVAHEAPLHPTVASETDVVDESGADEAASEQNVPSAGAQDGGMAAQPDDAAWTGETLHRLIDGGRHQYSPMTRTQETSILEASPGVGLVFASSAFGFEHLPESVQHLVLTGMDSPGACKVMPPAIGNGKETSNWIGDFVRANESAEHLLACQVVAVGSPDLADRIQAALRFCQEHSGGRLHVLYFLAPGGVWSWLTSPKGDRESLAGRLNPVFALEPWTVEAVQDRLMKEGKLHTPELAQSVLDATGGWSWCLDKFFDLCGKSADPGAAIAKMIQKLRPDAELHQELIMRTGARPDTIPQKALDYIRSKGELALDKLNPASIASNVSPEEARAAIRFLELMGCVATVEGSVRLVPFLERTLEGGNSA